jgi:para-nitrobenzyl esterase
MFKPLAARLLAGLLLSAPLAVHAQTPQPSGQNAVKPALSSNTMVGELLADPDAKAVLVADIPQVMANPQLSMGYGLKLRDIQQFEPTLTDEVLAKIDKDLAALQARRGH